MMRRYSHVIYSQIRPFRYMFGTRRSAYPTPLGAAPLLRGAHPPLVNRCISGSSCVRKRQHTRPAEFGTKHHFGNGLGRVPGFSSPGIPWKGLAAVLGSVVIVGGVIWIISPLILPAICIGLGIVAFRWLLRRSPARAQNKVAQLQHLATTRVRHVLALMQSSAQMEAVHSVWKEEIARRVGSKVAAGMYLGELLKNVGMEIVTQHDAVGRATGGQPIGLGSVWHEDADVWVSVKDGRRVADVSLPMPVAGAGEGCRLEYRALLDEIGPEGLVEWPSEEEEEDVYGGSFMSPSELGQQAAAGAGGTAGRAGASGAVPDTARSGLKLWQGRMQVAGEMAALVGRLVWRLGGVAAAAATGSLTPAAAAAGPTGGVKAGTLNDFAGTGASVPGYPAVPVWVGSALEAMPELVVHVQSCEVALPGGQRVDVTRWAAGEYVGHELNADAWEDVDSGLGRQAWGGTGADAAGGGTGDHPFGGLSADMREARDQTFQLMQAELRERVLRYRASGGMHQSRDAAEARRAIEATMGRRRPGVGATGADTATESATRRKSDDGSERVVEAEFREMPPQPGDGRQ